MKTTLNKRTDSMEQSMQAYAANCTCQCTASCPSCGCPCIGINAPIFGTVSSASQSGTPTSSNSSSQMNVRR